MRPRLLDLFCGAGGAAMGYHRAGFDVVGVDNRPQPNYPFEFRQADALYVAQWANVARHQWDAIHASPPCQFRSRATAWRGDRSAHPDLITPLRPLLETTGLPYVIETVQEGRAWLRNPTMLCGTHVGIDVQRHRYFEANWPLSILSLGCWHNGQRSFEHKQERAYADAMGCDWMTVKESRQAIPPAYTELIGHQLLAHVGAPVHAAGALRDEGTPA